MRKLLAIIGMLALIVFGITIGASAAGKQESIIDLTGENVPSSGNGWTWTVDGTTGTLTLNGLDMSATPDVFETGRPLVRFPETITDIKVILTGNNVIKNLGSYQCSIFYAPGKNITISGTGTLTFNPEDANSTLVDCDSLVMESGTISMATDCQAGYLFHTQNNLTITGGGMTFKSTYGIRSEKGPISITGGNIALTMTNTGYGICAGPNLPADTDEMASPAITISGGTIATNGSISDTWFKGLSITGGSIKADKEVKGNLFYAVSGNKVTLPDGFSTEQLSTTNSYILGNH